VSRLAVSGHPPEERGQLPPIDMEGPDGATEHAVADQREALRASLIDRLEKQIDLPVWLVAQGFHLAPTQPDLTHLAMTDRYGDTLLLWKDLERGTWTYASEREPADRGTIVDLMVRRDGVTRDDCINRMAACLDRSNQSREPAAYREAFRDRENILHRAEARHIAAVTSERVAVRDLERLGVERGTFDEWRFGAASTLLRNPTTLEHSRYRSGDRAMVFVERPIDAVAYERAQGKQHACYVYTGDNPDPEAQRKISHLLSDAPESLKVVLAFARDRRGADLAEKVAELAGHRPIERQPPEFGSRWSDQMQIEQRHRHSLTRLHDGGRPSNDPVLQGVRREIGRAIAAGVDEADIRTAIVRRRGLER
jgi:hypothetical protein